MELSGYPPFPRDPDDPGLEDWWDDPDDLEPCSPQRHYNADILVMASRFDVPPAVIEAELAQLIAEDQARHEPPADPEKTLFPGETCVEDMRRTLRKGYSTVAGWWGEGGMPKGKRHVGALQIHDVEVLRPVLEKWSCYEAVAEAATRERPIPKRRHRAKKR